MRALLHLPLEIASAILFAASIGIGAGVVVISYTHRLGDGFKAAPIVFVIAAAGFGYIIWRTYRPRQVTRPRRVGAHRMSVSQ